MVDAVSGVRDFATELEISPDEWAGFSPEGRDRLARGLIRRDRMARLDDCFGKLDDRFKAYLELCAEGRKQYKRPNKFRIGDEIPTLTQLEKYLGRDRSTIGDMRHAVRYDRVTHSTILCLAAIYPSADMGQEPSSARRHRLAAADAWLIDPEGITLLDWLHMIIRDPDDFEI